MNKRKQAKYHGRICERSDSSQEEPQTGPQEVFQKKTLLSWKMTPPCVIVPEELLVEQYVEVEDSDNDDLDPV